MPKSIVPEIIEILSIQIELQRTLLQWEIDALSEEIAKREEMLMNKDLRDNDDCAPHSHICSDCGRDCYCTAADYIGSDCEHDCDAEARGREEDRLEAEAKDQGKIKLFNES